MEYDNYKQYKTLELKTKMLNRMKSNILKYMSTFKHIKDNQLNQKCLELLNEIDNLENELQKDLESLKNNK